MGWFSSGRGEVQPLAPPTPQQEKPAEPEPERRSDESPLLEGASLDSMLPVASQLSFGSAAGYASGYALRAASRLAAGALGTAFICLQGLAYSGYIKVDWTKVESDYTKLFDVDQDGSITSQDVAVLYRRTMDVLQYNLPTGLGFAGGMLYGMGTTASTAGKAALLYGVGARIVLPRIAVAGASGLGAAGIPAFMAGLRVKNDVHAKDESFRHVVDGGNPRQLVALYKALDRDGPGNHERLEQLRLILLERGIKP